MLAYLKENPALAAILVACLVIIAVTAVILLIRRAKFKGLPPQENSGAEKLANADTAPTTDEASEKQNEADEQSEATNVTETLIEEKQEEEAEAETEEPKVEAPKAEEPKAPSVTEEEAPVKKAASKTAGTNTKNKTKENKSREGVMDLKDLKNAPIEDENDFYDEEDEADRIARYSGKWIICRLVTANSRSADAIHEGESDEETFFFELRASNGEKLLTSEEYTTYNGAINGIETHKANIARGNFKIVLSKKGDYLFKLLSGKNLLLCMGEHYVTKARCESAIESTKRFAKTAIVDENIQDIVITPPPESDDEEAPAFPDNGYNGKWIVSAQTAADGEQAFYFELFASNGEKLLSSEEYTTYIGAINGIETHKANIARGNFRISLTKRGDYIYKLLNGNGQLLCLGEHYKTKRRCESAIESVKRFAKNAPILSDSETVNKNA